MTATGPELTEPGEILRRNVPRAMFDGEKMSKTAFAPSDHDGMTSTLRGHVSVADAASRWEGNSPLIGTWPLPVRLATEMGLPCYDDGQQPCACGCEAMYPEDHASVDHRVLPSRSAQLRAARKIRDAVEAAGPLT